MDRTGAEWVIRGSAGASRRAFFHRRSLLRSAVRKYRNNRPRYVRQVDETAALGVDVVRLRGPREVERWMAALGRAEAEG